MPLHTPCFRARCTLSRTLGAVFLAALTGCVVPPSSGGSSTVPTSSLAGTTTTAPSQFALPLQACSGRGELDIGADGTIDLQYEVDVDAHGNDLRRDTYDGPTGELLSSITWTRTEDGRPLTFRAVENSWAEWSYDSDGNEIEHRSFYDGALSQWTETTWANGLRVHEEIWAPDQLIRATSWDYGQDGRELQSTREDINGNTDRTTWVWLGAGLDHDEHFDSNADGTVDATLQYRFDALGREIAYELEHATAGLLEFWEIVRDAQGREIVRTEADVYTHATTETVWGADGRIAEELGYSHGDLDTGTKSVTRWSWDCP